jgi:hypothetical protein
VALIIPFGLNGAAIASALTLAARALWLAASVRRRLGINTSALAAIPSFYAAARGRSELPVAAE